jgi:hypothetical protein
MGSAIWQEIVDSRKKGFGLPGRPAQALWQTASMLLPSGSITKAA